MPSKRLAVALAALVLLAGCSMIPYVGGDRNATPTPDAPDHHAFAFASDTDGVPFEATITVTKNGETLYETTVTGDGNGTYANLTQFSEPGPYTVTVNTTIPAAGGGNMSERFRTNGSLGNATLIRVAYQGIYHPTLRLPRRELTHEYALYASSPFDNRDVSAFSNFTVRVWYRGDRIVADTVRVPTDVDVKRLFELRRTGVYRVKVRSEPGDWSEKTIVITNPGHLIELTVSFEGGVRKIAVNPFGYPQ